MSSIDKYHLLSYYALAAFFAYIVNCLFYCEDNILMNNIIFTTMFVSALFVFIYINNNVEIIDIGWGLLGILLVIRNLTRIKVETFGQLFLIVSSTSIIIIYSVRHLLIYMRAFKGLDNRHINFRYKEIEDKFGSNRIGYWVFSYFSLNLLPNIILAMNYNNLLELYEVDKKFYNMGIFIIAYILSYFAIIFETVADEQLFIFRNNKDQKTGQLVMKTGLWVRIRHPNYLGEVLYFSSLLLMNYSFKNSFGVNSIGYILILSVFLFYSTPAMEKHLKDKYKSEYEEYQKKSYKLFPYIY